MIYYFYRIKGKRVNHMTYSEYLQIIADSDISDWNYDDERGSYLYLPDISIMMQSKKEDDAKEFCEKWVENYTNPKAYMHVIELYYNGMRIDDFYTAAVDGNRMYIPYPKIKTMSITQTQYGMGRIVNIPNLVNDVFNYDEYLKQGGITIK